MDSSKISLKSYIPSYKQYFDLIKEDKTISKYISFSEYDSNLIFYDNNFCGLYKVIDFDDEENKEIHIALVNEFRGLGLASCIIKLISNNVFQSNHNCQYTVLSIDKENNSSLKMAVNSGFEFNEELTKDNVVCGDENTIVFTKNNPYYKSLNKN